MIKYSIYHDKTGDVLYVKMAESKISHSSCIDGDDFIIVNYDDNNKAVGLQILGTEYLNSKLWNEHYKNDIPHGLFIQVGYWLKSMEWDKDHKFLIWMCSDKSSRVISWILFFTCWAGLILTWLHPHSSQTLDYCFFGYTGLLACWKLFTLRKIER